MGNTRRTERGARQPAPAVARRQEVPRAVRHTGRPFLLRTARRGAAAAPGQGGAMVSDRQRAVNALKNKWGMRPWPRAMPRGNE
jgi:hypothetical protein